MFQGAPPKIVPGFHRGPFVQRGFGIGSFLASIFRKIVPALFKTGKKVLTSNLGQKVVQAGKEAAVEGAISLARDALRGESLKDSAVGGLNVAKAKVSKALDDGLEEMRSNKRQQEQIAEDLIPLKTSNRKRKLDKKANLKKGRMAKRNWANYSEKRDLFDESFD
jgi:hypothetical protein